ncbi:MAG: CDP-2,3-bis-(O-geranylgeranyl)-sn-glycerol synthase [Candidatus Thorarchaeota archaeon]
MYDFLALLGLSVWFGLPAWIANAAPVVFGGGRPIDGGRLFIDGKRLFGDGKTVRGFVSGVLMGTMTGTVEHMLAPYLKPLIESYVSFSADMEQLLFMTIPVAASLSVGALLGDLFGSFLKRRFGIVSGGPAPLLDQIGFLIVALILSSVFIEPSPVYVQLLVLLTVLAHWISNMGGYLLGIKKHPW